MKPISIRNMDLKYYVITYLIGKQECIYFIVSSDQETAINHFLLKTKNSNYDINMDSIVNVRALDFINPN